MSSPVVDSRTGTYYARVRVPKDLVPLLKKKEIKRSLGTKDPRVAKARFSGVFSEIQSEFTNTRLLKTISEPSTPKLIPRDHNVLADRWLRDELEAIDQSGDHEILQNWLAKTPMGADTLMGVGLIDEGNAHPSLKDRCRKIAVSILTNHGITDSGDIEALSNELVRRVPQLSRLCLQRYNGTYNQAKTPLASTALTLEQKGLRLSELFEDYKNHLNGIPKGPKRLSDYTPSINQFIEFVNDKQIDQVSRYDINDFKKILLKCPSTQKRDIKSLPLARQAELAEANQMKLLSEGSVRNKLMHVSALFSFAVKEQLLLERNPCEQVSPPKASRVIDEEDREYTHEETAKIFALPVFTVQDYNPFPIADYGPALFWVPILCFYTGARPREIIQLRREDVRREEGIDFIKLSEKQDTEKSIKNENSFRKVPLHPDLIKLGFLKYAAQFKGTESLWPRNDETQTLSQFQNAFGRKWGEYIRKETDINVGVKPLHGWRHRFKSALRDLGTQDNTNNAVTGHSAQGVGNRYGRVWLTTSAKEINKLPSAPNLERMKPPSLKRSMAS